MTKKKKRSVIARIFRGIAALLFLLTIALIAIPYFFKDELKDMALKEADKYLLAKVDLKDFDLTFISSFPKMSIQLEGLKLTGKDAFEGVELVNVNNLEAKVNFWSVISGDKIEVEGIAIDQPKVNVQVLENGLANYDIMKPDSVVAAENPADTASNFVFKLKEFTINEGDIIYADKAGDMMMELLALNLSGDVGIVNEAYEVNTKADMKSLTFNYDGIDYLSKVATKMDVGMLMEMTDETMKFTFTENQFELNALKASLDGYYAMLEGRDEMDIKLITAETKFKDLLSLIPAFYTTGYESMATGGKLALNAWVKGTMDEVNMPGWDIDMKVDNASINYPDLPQGIDNINIDLNTKFAGGADLDKMTLDINKFTAKFAGNSLDANMKLRNTMTDPYIKAGVFADVDLATLGQVMPLAEGESYNGQLKSDLALEGRYSSIEKEAYDEFKASGNLSLKDVLYKSPDLPQAVEVENLAFAFTPQDMKLTDLKAKMGKSDFNASGTVDNYLAYALKDEPLKGTFNYSSNLLDMDDLMPASEEVASTEEETTTESSSDEVILVPGNIDFVLNAKINKLIYDGMEINNVTGDVVLRDEKASISNLKMDALGGGVLLNGTYNTQDHTTPKLDFAYDLKNLNIQELTKNFMTIEQMAPIAKYAQGLISSNFSMSTNLNADFTPDFTSLTANGDLFTQAVKVSGFKALQKMENVLSISNLDNREFKDIKAYFAVEDGKLSVKPFKLNLGQGITADVEGTTSLEQDIDYTLKMLIPKALIPKSAVDAAEKAIAQANKIPGFKMDGLPDQLPVTALIGNKITDPKVTSNLKEALLEQGGGIKDGVKNLVDEGVQNVKDTVNATIDKAKEDLGAAKEAKKKEIMAEAERNANKFRAEGKKAADAIRAEAEKGAQKLMDEAGSNPLKKKAAEVAGNKLKKEAEERAIKVENEANAKADKVIADAQKRVDAL
ncbi:AsmA-like C-terminal region [Lishizhenia tianjinensis]|uniref:AsmA-like C-terminal region n=1 Tax=Lishizhenia tianjinensis TaxID=477690 RepID=A0A1I6YY63_9FLAO|nr:AsmA-like C-terminal region-containing protein [Lishizhenia tianjinensis]SFT55352.1 AsmA-like C-terminal region [Lishizhenia tianjinensis]